MRNLPQRLNLARTACSLIGGLLLAGVLTACWEVNTYVKVGTCAPGSVRIISDPDDGAGACRPTSALQNPTDANLYNNAMNTSTGLAITDHVHMCNANTFMCQSNPGTKLCGGTYKPCKTRYTPTVPPDGLTGNCICGCP